MTDILYSLVLQYGLLAIFILMVSNGFFSAPPSELILTLAGLLALGAEYSLLETLLVAIAGNLAGTYILFWIGRRVGYRWLIATKIRISDGNLIERLIGGLIPEERMLIILEDKLRTGGAIWVCILRCLPFVRSIISLPAGMAQMRTIVFLVYSIIGISVWAILWQGYGYVLGNSWIQYGYIVTGILCIPLFLVLLTIKRKTAQYLKNNEK